MNSPPRIPAPGERISATTQRDIVRSLQAATPVPGRVKVRRLAGGSIQDFQPKKKLRIVPLVDHPFAFRDISTEEVPFTFNILSGQFIARGASGTNYMFPQVATAGSGVYLSDIPAPTFTVSDGKDAYVVLKAIYTVTSGVAVWSAAIIKTHEITADAPVTGLDNDYLNGHLLICRVARDAAGIGLVLKDTWIRSNVMHIKSNTFHHFWTVQ